MQIPDLMDEIAEELRSAIKRFAPFNSEHEGYAVIKEELDELWDEVKKRQSQRSPGDMRKEAIQVGAMAARFVLELCE
jgi:hypothetical protein